MGRQMNRLTEWIEGWMDEWMDGWMDGWRKKEGRKKGTDRQMDLCTVYNGKGGMEIEGWKGRNRK